MFNQIASYWKLHKFPILLVLISILFYYVYAYHLVRSDFVRLILLYGALFFFCFKLIQFEKWNYKFLLVAGILFRLVFLLAIPCLSQDFYRFIWDGEMILQGVNPYSFTPDAIIEEGVLIPENGEILHSGMGNLSARNFSNYPPLNQLLFALSTLLGFKTIVGSVIAMRVLIISADIGLFYFGRKLLKNLNKSPHMIFWYFLNPLVIIELSGNLHFEGVMLFLFVWAMYLLSRDKWIFAAIVFALSIHIKLIPLLFLPLFIGYFGWRKATTFYLIVAATGIMLLVPFYTADFTQNYLNTVKLWFSNFEFNAGLYNGLKHIAVQFDAKPWKLIKIYGQVTPLLIIGMTILFSFFTKKGKLLSLLFSMLWVLSIYYFLSTTVHPWYVIFLVFLCLFSDYRYPLFWSALIFLSYSAYSTVEYDEKLWLLFIEYFIVFGFMVYEIIRLEGQKLIITKN